MSRFVLVCALSLGFFGCSTSPEVISYPVRPIETNQAEYVEVNQVVIALDASSSMGQANKFPLTKTLADMLVNALPQGDYQVGLIVFGGKQTQVYPFEAFDRIEIETKIQNAFFLGGVSSFESQISHIQSLIKTASGKTAVFYFSDGRPINIGDALDAFNELADNAATNVCMHCIQIGFASGAQPLLQELANTTQCGSYRQGEAIHNTEGMQSFVKAALIERF